MFWCTKCMWCCINPNTTMMTCAKWNRLNHLSQNQLLKLNHLNWAELYKSKVVRIVILYLLRFLPSYLEVEVILSRLMFGRPNFQTVIYSFFWIVHCVWGLTMYKPNICHVYTCVLLCLHQYLHRILNYYCCFVCLYLLLSFTNLKFEGRLNTLFNLFKKTLSFIIW